MGETQEIQLLLVVIPTTLTYMLGIDIIKMKRMEDQMFSQDWTNKLEPGFKRLLREENFAAREYLLIPQW